jgi:hypothetical protein
MPSLHEYFLNVQNRKYTSSTPLPSAQNFLSNESLFARIGLRTRELRPFYFGDEICPEISERATLNVSSITPCTGLQTRWFLMCWNGNLMELLDISFSSFVHLWTSSQIDENSSIIVGFGEVDDLSCNSLSMTSLFIIQALSTRLVKIGPSPDTCFFKVIILTKRKAWSRFTKLIVNMRVHN